MVETPIDPIGLTLLSNPEDAVVDIVFVHGLQGHPRNTWTASSNAPSPSKNTPSAPSASRSRLKFLRPKRKRPRETDQAENSANIENVRKRPRETDQVENSANIEYVQNDAKTEEVFWPKDLLAADFPKARIMTFGYNTNVQQGFHATNQGTIFSHARDLLFALEAKRRKAPTRNLIFVAHSLGGILVKEILRRSEADYDDEIKNVYISTIGVFFFGTPHRGSKEWASFSEGVTTIAGNILGMDVNRQVVHALIAGPELELCRESFTTQWVKRGSSLTVRTFQESKGMTGVKWGGFNQLIVSPDSSILDHPNQRARTIEANHMTMVQFSSRTDRGYEMVTGDIEVLIVKAENMTKNSITEKILSKEERICLQALRTSEYEQFKDRNPSRLEGTCQWFLQHENFKSWRENESSSLLWVSADPGCGKSVLSKSLVDVDLKAISSSAVCYYFFKDDNDKQKSHAAAFSALLHQLFSKRQSLIKYALPDYDKEGSNLPQSFTKLWNILTNATCDAKAGEIICILDALDECEESGRYDIIQVLNSFYWKAGTNGSKLKFIVTSRPYFDIERRFAQLTNNFPTIRLQGEQESEAISLEINIVIKQRVRELGVELNLEESEMSSLEKEFLSMRHRTYLWLRLVLDVIRNEIGVTTKKLKKITGTLPATVDQAYEAILSRSRHKRQAQKALHIIIAAKRPLTLKEMNIALAIEDHHRSYEDLDLENETRFATTLRNLCGLFVSVIDEKVYLIHQTAKEFLVTEGQASLTRWKHSLSPVESEFAIARTCIAYLMFDIFKDGLIGTTKEQNKSHSYLKYAAIFWSSHYEKAQSKASDTISQSVLQLYDTQCPRFQLWFGLFRKINFDRHCPNLEASTIIVASYFGHEFIVMQQLNSEADIESRNRAGNMPLSFAALRGHEGVVKLLLEAGANIDSKNNSGDTPLSLAAYEGHEGVVKLLLEAGANTDSKNNDGDTPLSLAAFKGHEGVVKLLLEARANTDSKNDSGGTPLSAAAHTGHEGVVKLLLEARANTDSKNIGGDTPLSVAAYKGHEGVVKLLLEAGANTDSKNNRGGTPLSLAAFIGHEGVVKLLLEARANTDSKNDSGGTPLSAAAFIGHEGVVKLLLEARANTDSKNDSGGTPLSAAAHTGHEGVVKLLLEARANTDSKNIGGDTPLSVAAYKGHEGVVKLLLEAGANTDSKNNRGDTPLSLAAQEGRESVYKLLQSVTTAPSHSWPALRPRSPSF